MTITALSFDQWFGRLQELAFEAEWPLGDPSSYQEYFDDGDSPEDTLALEMSYIEDDYEDDEDEVDEEYEARRVN